MKKRQAAVLAVIVFVITAVLLVNVSWEKKDKEAKYTVSEKEWLLNREETF